MHRVIHRNTNVRKLLTKLITLFIIKASSIKKEPGMKCSFKYGWFALAILTIPTTATLAQPIPGVGSCVEMVRPENRSNPYSDTMVRTYELTALMEVDGMVVPVFTPASCEPKQVFGTMTIDGKEYVVSQYAYRIGPSIDPVTTSE